MHISAFWGTPQQPKGGAFSRSTTSGASAVNAGAEPQGLVAATPLSSAPLGSSSMMASLFFDHTQQESRYILARKESFLSQNELANQMMAIVSWAGSEIAGVQAGRNAEKVLIGMQAERMAEDAVDGETSEAAEEVVEEAKEDIEERAEEAVAPEGDAVAQAPGEALKETQEDVEERTEEAEAAAAPAEDMTADDAATRSLSLTEDQAQEATPVSAPSSLATAYTASGATSQDAASPAPAQWHPTHLVV